MKGEWCYFKSHFNTAQCKLIIDSGLAIPSKDAIIGPAGQVQENYRRSKVRFLQSQSGYQWLFDDLWKLAIRANNDWFGFHITKLDYIQMAEYNHTYAGEYKKHQDVFWITENPLHRKLSCIVQLTAPTEYEGCDLELYDCNEAPPKDEIKQQGTVIFFPSFVQHAALPITKGIRYSLAAWFEGPKWH